MPKKNAAEKPLAAITASLDEIVSRLEKEEISIEEALVAYEEGIGLISEAQQRLNAAEQTVRMLSEKNGLRPESEPPGENEQQPE